MVLLEYRCTFFGGLNIGGQNEVTKENQIMNKLVMFMPKQDIKRAHFKFIDTKDGLIIRFDTHGLSRLEAKKLINNVTALYREAFFLHIIHGYSHGTAIKDMLWDKEEVINSRFIRVRSQKNNPGETIIKVMSAYSQCG